MYVRKTTMKKGPKPNLNECYYSPVTPNTLQMQDGVISIVSPHEYCYHTHYCIFNENRTNLEKEITGLENELTRFKNIKDATINGEIIYAKELDDYYNVSVDVYTGIDGGTHCKTDVTLKDNFMGALNRKIDNLEYDLQNLLRFRIDVLHGKIGGYGV